MIIWLFHLQIVFSDAWWIGRKDENPEEARLQFPAELNVVGPPMLRCSFRVSNLDAI